MIANTSPIDKLYNTLDTFGADAMCEALLARGTCNGYKCDECCFKSQEILEAGLEAIEEEGS